MELQPEHNFGMRVTGRTRGRTGLKVVLRVTDPEAGQLVRNLQELRDEIQIQVQQTQWLQLSGESAVNIVSGNPVEQCCRNYMQIFHKNPFAYHDYAPLRAR